ncbi:MAG: sulfatase [Akkermansiaceae bacterium]|nr:sulfatase [Akkermansiaceae bacterium]
MKFSTIALVILTTVVTYFAQAEDQRPNFVFILADDCTFRDLELYGGPAKTPHINKLAAEGLTFHRCYQAAPMCSPTRHALYTGIYPVKNGAHPNHSKAYKHIKSIVHYLGAAGYDVVLAGKSHVAPASVFPFKYVPEFADPLNKDVKVHASGWRYPKVYNTMRQAAEKQRPFCLFLASNEPHTPYTKGDPTPYLNAPLSPQQLPNKHQKYAEYLAEITYFDGQVGEVLRMIDQLKLKDNTLVMVATEQGSQFPFGKWTCYDVGVASGLVARWPGKIAPGKETHAIVEYTDIVPTFLDAAGAPIPEILDGKSFLPLLKGEKSEHSQYAYSLQTTCGVDGYKSPYGIRSVVGKRYRYILNLFPENEFSIPISRSTYEETRGMDGQYKKFGDRYMKRPAEELYDVIADPYCQNNLIADKSLSETKNELRKKLRAWMASQNDLGRKTELDANNRQTKPRLSIHSKK